MIKLLTALLPKYIVGSVSNHHQLLIVVTAMTLEENKSVVRHFYEEVHGGNLGVLGESV
jgi:hypothetical protein